MEPLDDQLDIVGVAFFKHVEDGAVAPPVKAGKGVFRREMRGGEEHQQQRPGRKDYCPGVAERRAHPERDGREQGHDEHCGQGARAEFLRRRGQDVVAAETGEDKNIDNDNGPLRPVAVQLEGTASQMAHVDAGQEGQRDDGDVEQRQNTRHKPGLAAMPPDILGYILSAIHGHVLLCEGY